MNKKQVETTVSELFKKHGLNKQFNIFNLSKVMDGPRKLLSAGHSIEDAEKEMIKLINQYQEIKK